MASKSHWSASAEVTGTDAYATSTLSHQATSPAPQIILTFCPRGLSTLFVYQGSADRDTLLPVQDEDRQALSLPEACGGGSSTQCVSFKVSVCLEVAGSPLGLVLTTGEPGRERSTIRTKRPLCEPPGMLRGLEKHRPQGNNKGWKFSPVWSHSQPLEVI